MFGIKAHRGKGGKEEAEKPFWISFSDLMTALMVLFLVAMAVALMAVTQGLAEIKKIAEDRDGTIRGCIVNLEKVAKEFPGINVRPVERSIEFGKLVEFGNDDHTLDPAEERFVRDFVSRVLKVARDKTCDQWLKRVVVEGFASEVGSYLYNLNLSFLRSQRILCVLLDSKAKDALAIGDRKEIRSLFLAGGSSFNTVSQSPEGMRRVELRLEFRELGAEKEAARSIPWDEDAKCPNDTR